MQMAVNPGDDPHHQVYDCSSNKKDNHSLGIIPYQAATAQLLYTLSRVGGVLRLKDSTHRELLHFDCIMFDLRKESP